jgi:hypothetical protein
VGRASDVQHHTADAHASTARWRMRGAGHRTRHGSDDIGIQRGAQHGGKNAAQHRSTQHHVASGEVTAHVLQVQRGPTTHPKHQRHLKRLQHEHQAKQRRKYQRAQGGAQHGGESGII